MIKYLFFCALLIIVNGSYGEEYVGKEKIHAKGLTDEESNKIVKSIKDCGIVKKIHPKLEGDSVQVDNWNVNVLKMNKISVHTKYGEFFIDRKTGKITSVVFLGNEKELHRPKENSNLLYNESAARKLAKEIASAIMGDIRSFTIEYELIEKSSYKFYHYTVFPKTNKGDFLDERIVKISIDAVSGNLRSAYAKHSTVPENIDYSPKLKRDDAKKIFDENTKNLSMVTIKQSGLVNKKIKGKYIWVWQFKFTYKSISGKKTLKRSTSGYVDSENGIFYPGMIW